MSIAFYACPEKYRTPLNEAESEWKTLVNKKPSKDFLEALAEQLNYKSIVIFNEINFHFDYQILIFDQSLLEASPSVKISKELQRKSILVVDDARIISEVEKDFEYLCIVTKSALKNWKKEKGIGIIGKSYGFYGKKELFDELIFNKQLAMAYEYINYYYFTGIETNNLVKILTPYLLKTQKN
jgi:hypothetical protein